MGWIAQATNHMALPNFPGSLAETVPISRAAVDESIAICASMTRRVT